MSSSGLDRRRIQTLNLLNLKVNKEDRIAEKKKQTAGVLRCGKRS